MKIKEIIDKVTALADWPLFCKAKSTVDSSCADDAVLSPLAYLDALGGANWPDKS